jgi:hypothetical protein
MFGGRMPKPCPDMTGGTMANSDFCKAEYLVTEEEVGSTKFKARQMSKSFIKHVTVNEGQ